MYTLIIFNLKYGAHLHISACITLFVTSITKYDKYGAPARSSQDCPSPDDAVGVNWVNTWRCSCEIIWRGVSAYHGHLDVSFQSAIVVVYVDFCA